MKCKYHSPVNGIAQMNVMKHQTAHATLVQHIIILNGASAVVVKTKKVKERRAKGDQT